MSYKLFDQGLPPEEIQNIKKAQGVEDKVMDDLRKWKESEHVLNILRTIKASEKALTRLELEAWRKAMRPS